MAKKRVMKKVSKKSSKRSSPVLNKKTKQISGGKVRATKNKFNLVLKNLILFIVLTIISWVLYSVSNDSLYQTFFQFLSWIFGIVSLAFIISLLVLLFLRAMRR